MLFMKQRVDDVLPTFRTLRRSLRISQALWFIAYIILWLRVVAGVDVGGFVEKLETVSRFVAAVGALPVEDPSGGETKLSVGVGIASGEAFVGNIQAVDRMIWTAIGNTTNLAARLQSLTRELDASLVIDAGTWGRAQPAAQDFEKRSRVPIRGRREAQDVYALPLSAHTA